MCVKKHFISSLAHFHPPPPPPKKKKFPGQCLFKEQFVNKMLCCVGRQVQHVEHCQLFSTLFSNFIRLHFKLIHFFSDTHEIHMTMYCTLHLEALLYTTESISIHHYNYKRHLQYVI